MVVTEPLAFRQEGAVCLSRPLYHDLCHGDLCRGDLCHGEPGVMLALAGLLLFAGQPARLLGALPTRMISSGLSGVAVEAVRPRAQRQTPRY